MLELSPELTQETANLMLLGALLAVSIVADVIANRTRIPRISILVMVGLAYAVVDQLVLGNAYSTPLGDLNEPLVSVALVMVAFLLGGELTLSALRTTGPTIMVLSLSVVLTGAALVGAGISLLGYSVTIALSLAAISVATDPAAVRESIQENGNHGPRARIVLGIVAIDDAWGILSFGLAMAALGWFVAGHAGAAIGHALWELGGALLLGAALGLPAAWLTGRLKPGQPTLVEALALILLLAGLADYLNVSALLAAMVTGFIVVNLSSHHTRSFTEIEHIEWPFLIFFFVLSGASVNLTELNTALSLVVAYIALRALGRYLGGYLGVRVLSRQPNIPGSIGLSLMPQAGVAIGMALLAAERFPEQGGLILTTVVVSTLVFEMLGPVLTRYVLQLPGGDGQTRRADQQPDD